MTICPQQQPVGGRLAQAALLVVLLAPVGMLLRTPGGGFWLPRAVELALALHLAVPLMLLLMGGKLQRQLLPYLLLWGAAFLWAFASFYWSQQPALTAQRTLLVFLPSLLLVMVLLSLPRIDRLFWSFACAMIVLGTSLAGYAILLFAFGEVREVGEWRVQAVDLGPFSVYQRVQGGHPIYRVSSLLRNATDFGLLLLISLTCSLALASRGRHPWLWGAAIGLQGVALGLTLARSALLAALVAAIVYWILLARSLPRALRRLTATAALGGTAAALLLVSGAVADSGRFSLDLNLRDLAWGELLRAFSANPWGGVGFGVSDEAVLLSAGATMGAHSFHLATLSEVGLIGYLLFTAVWLVPVGWALRRPPPHDSVERLIVAAAVALLVALFVHQAFQGLIFRYTFFHFVMVFLAACAARSGASRLRARSSSSVVHHRPAQRRPC